VRWILFVNIPIRIVSMVAGWAFCKAPSPSRPRAAAEEMAWFVPHDGFVASRRSCGSRCWFEIHLDRQRRDVLQSGALFAMWFFVLPYLQESTGTRRTRRDSPPVSSTRRARSVRGRPGRARASCCGAPRAARPAALPVRPRTRAWCCSRDGADPPGELDESARKASIM